MDGVAGTKFLLEGQPKHFFAVIHAHFSYYKRLPSTLRKRREMKQKQGFTFHKGLMYKGNLVIEYFLAKKNTFTQLKQGFYSN